MASPRDSLEVDRRVLHEYVPLRTARKDVERRRRDPLEYLSHDAADAIGSLSLSRHQELEQALVRCHSFPLNMTVFRQMKEQGEPIGKIADYLNVVPSALSEKNVRKATFGTKGEHIYRLTEGEVFTIVHYHAQRHPDLFAADAVLWESFRFVYGLPHLLSRIYGVSGISPLDAYWLFMWREVVQLHADLRRTLQVSTTNAVLARRKDELVQLGLRPDIERVFGNIVNHHQKLVERVERPFLEIHAVWALQVLHRLG